MMNNKEGNNQYGSKNYYRVNYLIQYKNYFVSKFNRIDFQKQFIKNSENESTKYSTNYRNKIFDWIKHILSHFLVIVFFTSLFIYKDNMINEGFTKNFSPEFLNNLFGSIDINPKFIVIYLTISYICWYIITAAYFSGLKNKIFYLLLITFVLQFAFPLIYFSDSESWWEILLSTFSLPIIVMPSIAFLVVLSFLFYSFLFVR